MNIWEKEKREQGENFRTVRKWRSAARRHFRKSGQQHLLAHIPRQNYTTGERHRNRGRGTTQKSRKRDNIKGMNCKADLGTNCKADALLKSVWSVQVVQQVLGMFSKASHTTFNVFFCCKKMFWLFADWHNFQGRVQAHKSR